LKHRLSVVAAGAALVLLSACAGDQSVTVRPLATGFAEGEKPASFRVAEARAHFALGNVALAAEGFRRALREDPASVDAMNGLAACYDRMGRFDLARSLYEQALALAPDDARLYANLATSLDLQGRLAEAATLRKEASARFAMASRALPLSPPPQVAPPVPPASSVTVALTEAQPAATPSPERGPRLERTSLGEVTLRSGGGPSWTSLRQATAATSSRHAAAQLAATSQPLQVVVLNGTREAGLAARTRQHLRSSGWSAVTIGDTADPLRGSQILYSASHAREARRLAEQLGLPLRQRNWSANRLVVQLGRDRLKRASPA
jgi:tetratricopeptide (TPR) repeat protein